MLKYTTLAALLFAASALGAQQQPASPPTGSTVTFDDAISIALRQNTAIRQAKNAVAVGSANVQQQKLAFLPDLRVSTNTAQGYGRTFDQGVGQLINQTTNTVTAGLSSTVTLFDGLRSIATLRSARLGEQASSQDLDRAKQTVVFTVASNYLALVSQQEQLRVQRENLAAQEEQEKQIQQFVNAGSRPIADLYQQQATTAGARASAVTAQNALELAKVDLMQTLQLDPSGAYDFQPPALGDTTIARQQYNLDSLLALAFRQRVDLDAQQTRVNASQQDVKAASASKWPTISLTGGYNSGVSSATDLGFLDQLDQRRGGSIAVGISIPLFDRGVTQAATERARIDEDNARLAYDTQRQQVALDVRRAYLDHQAAQQQLEAADAQHRSADLAVTATQARYQVGAATLLELTQARATQVQASSALISARYNLIFQQALMSYYTGELDPHHVSLGAT